MRLAVYTDYAYHRENGSVFAERAFVVFLARLAEHLDQMVLVGRLDPRPERAHYRIPPSIDFVPLPHYESQVQPLRLGLSLVRSLRRFWRALDGVDAVWLLGPHPVAIAFTALARLRRKSVALGVRQDLPTYVRSRHPDRRWTHAAALVLDWAYRMLARRYPVVVVGPELARRYRSAPRLLPLTVSLVSEGDIVQPGAASARSYDDELSVLSVGRLETEKNPLLLAEVLARLEAKGGHWRLVVCGEGPLAGELSLALQRSGVAESADLRGYVPIDGGLADLYRECHAFLHVSWTEGLPQVLFEAFAAGLPVVATAVGGVPEAVGEAALLVPPGDAEAAAAALARIATEPALRARLVEAGIERVRSRTLESESRRAFEFLVSGHAGASAGSPAPR